MNDSLIKDYLTFFKNEKVDFFPGEKFEYNNSGYVLLGYIIDSLLDSLTANTFKKLPIILPKINIII